MYCEKAEKLANTLTQLDWHADVIYRPELDESVVLASRNGSEYIEAVWREDLFVAPGTFIRGERVSRVRVPAELVAKATVSTTVQAENNGRRVRYSVPFNPADTSVEEVLAAVRGRKVIFRNSLSGLLEEVHVDKYFVKKFKLEIGTAGRTIMTFAAAGEGFRSIALDSIVRVR